MELDTLPSERISLELDNGRTVQVEVIPTGRSDVSFEIIPFREVTDTLEGVINALGSTISKVTPNKASIRFGIDIGFESGSLTAVIVKGNANANLEITLEWEYQER